MDADKRDAVAGLLQLSNLPPRDEKRKTKQTFCTISDHDDDSKIQEEDVSSPFAAAMKTIIRNGMMEGTRMVLFYSRIVCIKSIMTISLISEDILAEMLVAYSSDAEEIRLFPQSGC